MIRSNEDHRQRQKSDIDDVKQILSKTTATSFIFHTTVVDAAQMWKF
uniref:Uncharacterized protein n=1 Tax=Physcomitrium patens TaxID=3218 RepID=A0A2K1IYV4_PHYPA|nr:hypothetical protein PHYPA_024258 [Physcomitrium patens]